MDWKHLLAYITGSVGQELLLRNEYLVTENRLLRSQIKGRVQLSNSERKTLAAIGKKLGRQTLEEVASIVKLMIPQTFRSILCPCFLILKNRCWLRLATLIPPSGCWLEMNR